MATTEKFALRYLSAVEKKYKDFFESNNLSIMDCVAIVGSDIVNVQVLNDALPIEVSGEIESMFQRNN